MGEGWKGYPVPMTEKDDAKKNISDADEEMSVIDVY